MAFTQTGTGDTDEGGALLEVLQVGAADITHGSLQAAGELVHAAYKNHLDSQINDQYRSLHGSLRFLHNIVRFPGCGIFDVGGSLVLRDAAGALDPKTDRRFRRR